jgi:hypothetical protein
MTITAIMQDTKASTIELDSVVEVGGEIQASASRSKHFSFNKSHISDLIFPVADPKILLTLPTELHIKIFTYLDAVDSTCLALTCKSFYKIYRNSSNSLGIRLPVSLFQVRKGLRGGYYEAWSTGNLLGALYQWIGPNLVLNVHISKLVTRKRDKEIFDETFPDGWHSIDLRKSVEEDLEEREQET